jgi:hypothetical protein
VSERAVAAYAAAVRERYRRAKEGEKGTILDECCRVTGYHSKAAIRLLGRAPGPPAALRAGGRGATASWRSSR